jgi:hypothetical protein
MLVINIAINSEITVSRYVVSGTEARIKRQHGDEMRRPDAEARGGGIQGQPHPSRSASCHLRALETNSDGARQKAHRRREHDKPPIVLCREAAKDAIHAMVFRICSAHVSSLQLSRSRGEVNTRKLTTKAQNN